MAKNALSKFGKKTFSSNQLLRGVSKKAKKNASRRGLIMGRVTIITKHVRTILLTIKKYFI